jgi:Ca2+-binding RTX toxin-like protein
VKRSVIWGVAAATILAATPAHASTIGLEGTTVTLRVGTGEAIPTVRYQNYGPAFAQPPEYAAYLGPPGTVTATAGCQQNNPQSVVCYDHGITAFAAHFGDSNDTLEPTAGVLGQHAPFPVPTAMYGNGGHDNLTGSKVAANRLEGGPGSDKLVGGEASDQLYAGLDGGTLEGHGGDDLIYGGDTGQNGLVGGAGNDQIFSGAAGGSLWGEAGSDVLTGGPAAEFLEGGLDVDTLIGADGNDQLNGGPGRDRIDGGAGDDVIQAADGSPDEIVCGPGVDRVVRDRLDRLPADCEVAPRLRLSGYFVNGYTVGVTLRRFSEPVNGRVSAHRCLTKLGHQLSCTKTERPGNFGGKRFSGKPGDRVKIRIKLDPADVRNRLRQPGRNPKRRDVYLLIRFRDRDGQEGARGTRLLIKLP